MAGATMLLSPHPQPLCSLPFHANFHQLHPWLRWQRCPPTLKKLHMSLEDPIISSPSALADFITRQQQLNPNSFVLLADSVGYSLASYYTSLGLFVISVPGLWSVIKRSVKSKIVKKAFIGEGEKKAPNQAAGEIQSFFTCYNFAVFDTPLDIR